MDKKPENPPYAVDYRNIKYPRLEFKTGTLLLVLPKNYQKQTELLEKHKKWISTKHQAIKTALQEARTKTLNQTRSIEELKTLVNKIALDYQTGLNLKINNIYFRKMKTKWGSYSPKRNLTINTYLKYLPEKLIEYIIFHEMIHALERKHNDNFWRIIGKRFKDHQTREKNLLVYWFLVQETLRSARTPSKTE